MIKDRPYAATMVQTQILYDIASMLEELVETIPKGVARGVTLSIGSTPTVITDTLDMPWITVDVFNDGPDPVYVAVNEEHVINPPLYKGESLKVDMVKPKIEKLCLFCDDGKTATIRLFYKK
jgi:hypothetical protein